jgi:large subunit ribosomal protein L1
MGKTKIKKTEEEPVIMSNGEGSLTNVSPASAGDSSEPEAGQNDKVHRKTEAPKQGAPKQRSKKYLEASEKVERTKNYSLAEAVELAKTTGYTKFTGTIEVHVNTSQKNLRGLVSLPFAAGKKLRLLVFGAKEGQFDKEVVTVGTEESVQAIVKGGVKDFDVVVSTPAWMPKLATAARVLGPRGLMPNPKSGTVTENLDRTVADLSAGKIEYKTESNGSVIHMNVGKSDQDTAEISENVRSLYNTLGKSRVKKITLAPTMGPGVRVDLKSI